MSSNYRKLKNYKRGFGLLETILAVLLGGLVMIFFVTITTQNIAHARTVQRLQRVHSNASHVATVFEYWGKQASRFETPTATGLDITLADLLTKKRFIKTGSILYFDNAPLTTSDVQVTAATFTIIGTTARISYTLSTAIPGEDYTFITTVTKRNTF